MRELNHEEICLVSGGFEPLSGPEKKDPLEEWEELEKKEEEQTN